MPASADIGQLQLEDSTLSQVLIVMKQKHRPSHAVTNSYDNGSTIRHLVVPFSLRSDILGHIHAGSVGGYLGQSKSLQKLMDHFYWPEHYNNVIMWCSTCSCATRKVATPKAKAPLDPIMAGSPLQLVGVDLPGPLPKI
uniref:Integrase zinc-binding domain-containing protein n=1 Tax=Amphimedon queenslandica TaxID=400682 RepID=A0A1X7U6P3_AMPQE